MRSKSKDIALVLVFAIAAMLCLAFLSQTRAVPLSEGFEVSSAAITASVTPSSTPQPSAADVPKPFGYAAQVASLRERALKSINHYRDAAGVEPLILGNNSAAQTQAEFLLSIRSVSKWNAQGEKPYLRYQNAGGTGNVWELSSGYFCGLRDCQQSLGARLDSVVEDIYSENSIKENNFPNATVSVNFNIVNLGIAFDSSGNLIVVEDFETNVVSWITRKSEGDLFIFEGTMPPDLHLDSIVITQESFPFVISTQDLQSPSYSQDYDYAPAILWVIQPRFLIRNPTTEVTRADIWSEYPSQSTVPGYFKIVFNETEVNRRFGAGLYNYLLQARPVKEDGQAKYASIILSVVSVRRY